MVRFRIERSENSWSFKACSQQSGLHGRNGHIKEATFFERLLGGPLQFEILEVSPIR